MLCANAGAIGLGGCGSGETEEAGCVSDADCDRGELCRAGRCVLARDSFDSGGRDGATCIDGDDDGYPRQQGCGAPVDCADDDPDVHPGAEEICDQVDNDCDGDVDEGFDELGDLCTVGEGPCWAKGTVVCNPDGDGVACDAEPAEGSKEVCDGIDNDCDGVVDNVDDSSTSEGESSVEHCGKCENDCRDFFPNARAECRRGGCVMEECKEPYRDLDGALSNGCEYRCDAAAKGVESAGDDFCDGLDNDCDGETDEDATGMVNGEQKSVGDECTAGVGQCEVRGTVICSDGGGVGRDAGVGPDTGPSPDAAGARTGLVCDARPRTPSPEICDNLDNDCDGTIDNGCDDDGDGYCDDAIRSVGSPTICPKGAGDCDDENARVNPGMNEQCDDNVDNDCDGRINENCDCDFDGTPTGVCSNGTVDSTGTCQAPAEYQNQEWGQCDQKDNDCDGVTDEGCTCTYDSDGDGDTADESGVCTRAEIDDQGRCARPSNYEATESTCDSVDNDCDGVVDEGCDCSFQGSSVGVCGESATNSDGSCARPPNYEATESSCDGFDNDCDGVVDEGCSCNFQGRTTGVCDGGGTVDPATGKCGAPADYSSPETAPGSCDRKDNDCDGVVDENCSCIYDPTENDGDRRDSGDGGTDHGVCLGQIVNAGTGKCERPAKYERDERTCDGLDNDCDGEVDEGCDDDGDGRCDSYLSVVGSPSVCPKSPPGVADDCADGTPQSTQAELDWMAQTYPGAASNESAQECMRDVDGDGYGDKSPPTRDSTAGIGSIQAGTDCDDRDDTVNPGATEVVGDGADSNCDGVEKCYADRDGDGYRSSKTVTSSNNLDCSEPGEAAASAPAGDCDDSDAAIHPGATEIAGDEIDSNCDGREICFVDADGDGYRTTDKVSSSDVDCGGRTEATRSAPKGDCLDSDSDVHPGAAPNESAQGGACHADRDGDGWGDANPSSAGVDPGSDCDDSNSNVHPNANERCDSSTDYDCDGAAQCGDSECGGSACSDPGSSCASGSSNDACKETRCSDGIDNNRPYRGRSSQGADCFDPACSCTGASKCEDTGRDDPQTGADIGECIELSCRNGRDDDGDGATDCEDDDCKGRPPCDTPGRGGN